MQHIQRITVIGATGMLGKPVARELTESGFEVTALVRNTEKAKTILPAAVRLIQGNLQNIADVEKSVQKADIIYLNLSVEPNSDQKDFQPEREGLANVLTVSRKLNIKRIAYLSSIVQHYTGFNWWVFNLKREAISAIKQSGIPYTIFYPSNFMETIPERFVQGNKILLAGRPLYKNYWIAGSDYGKQVAKSFHLSDAANQEYFIQGKEAFTMDEASELFARYYSKKRLKLFKVPLGMLRLFGNFSNQINYGAKIIEAISHYDEKFKAQQAWRELGEPEVTIKKFAENRN